MTGHYFVSYSGVDGLEFALWLADTLAAGPPSFPAVVDKREMRPGEDWDAQLAEAIRDLPRAAVSHDCRQRQTRLGHQARMGPGTEVQEAGHPAALPADAELPFRLGSRQFIDLTSSFEAGLARLRNHLTWMDTPEGVLQALKERLEDAERELPRAGNREQTRINQEIQELHRQIAAQERVWRTRRPPARTPEQRIAQRSEREREPERPVVPFVAGEVHQPAAVPAPT